MARQITAGQNVKKNNKPGPMGFGLGSGQRPISASRMIPQSGPEPITSSQKPICTSRFLRYSFIASDQSDMKRYQTAFSTPTPVRDAHRYGAPMNYSVVRQRRSGLAVSSIGVLGIIVIE